MDLKATVSEYWYTPEWNGNKALPEKERVTVLLKKLTNRERQRCLIGPDESRLEKFFEAAVPEIKGLSVGGVAITSGAALLDAQTNATEDLYIELHQEIQRSSTIGEDDQKN